MRCRGEQQLLVCQKNDVKRINSLKIPKTSMLAKNAIKLQTIKINFANRKEVNR